MAKTNNDGITVVLKDDETTELTFRAYISGKPETAKTATLKLQRILKGFWLNEDNEELTQENGVNNNVLFGQKVKIKLITSHTNDGEILHVEIKLKKGDKYIELEESEKEKLKLKLKVKNNEAISEPFYLDPRWYSEEIEKYNYDKHQTEIDSNELLTFVFDAKYEKQDAEHGRKNLPKEADKKLKPISYRRNYEELIGLFKTDNSGEKHKENNYENKFINNNSEIKSIVDEFTEKVIEQDITISDIETLVEEKATALWNSAVNQVQNGNLDDRPLYWARNKMQTWLKRNPLFKDQIDFDKSVVEKGSELENIIALFENKSRNYTGIDFSKAGNKKKVLVTGFDPFQLNPDTNFNTSMGIDSADTFNPSGIVALHLNENLIDNDIYIQTCIFPVRYEDFDKKYVEKLVLKHIAEVDAIITTSLNGGNNWFDIEADAIKYRGGFHDNMCIGGQDYIKFNYNSERFKTNTSNKHNLTTLPKSKILGNHSSIDINGLIVKYDTTKLNSQTEGGGGNYLSNEIMFRATSIRGDKYQIPVGHFHLANLRTIKRSKEILNVTEIVIKKIID